MSDTTSNGYDATAFGADLLTAAQDSLPYIGGGVAAGVVVFAVIFGIRKGLGALRATAGK